ncbi:MAG: cbb3-type cytochrome c oxidase N-terminal domain-containing protein [Ferruginibacter sp.]
MRFIPFINKKFLIAMPLLLAAGTAAAQDAAAAEKTVMSSYNQLATLLVVMTIVLAFVIWGLGQVLVILSRQLMEKSKAAAKVVAVLVGTALLFVAQSASAQDATAAAVKEVPNYGGLSSTTFYFFAITVVVEVLAILFLAFSIRRVYKELIPAKAAATEKSGIRLWWDNMDKKLFTKAVPVEKEADVLLDHDYDGIKELDNALPPWWKYGFYITIVVAFIYIGYYHTFGSGKSPFQEYTAEMDRAKIEKEAYDAQNKDKIDESNVPMANADGLAKAKQIFGEKCWPCHGKLGEGGAGPNLTDDYWIHKGSLNDIYKSIKTGYPDKGMQSWATNYSPKEMSFLASYIKTLHGTNPPNAKAPQGDLFTETAAPAAADSAKGKASDSAAAKKAVAAVKDTVNVKAAPAK